MLPLPAMAKATTGGGKAKPTGSQSRDFEKVTYRLEPAQAEALRREAIRRASARGSMKADASEIVRELVAAWRAMGTRR
jgi:hypothetical protein